MAMTTLTTDTVRISLSVDEVAEEDGTTTTLVVRCVVADQAWLVTQLTMGDSSFNITVRINRL